MILQNDFQRLWTLAGDRVLDAVREVGESGWYILGKRVSAFEDALAAHWGIPHATGVASGLDAIELSLRALGCGPGDRVLTSPLSAFATPLAIIRVGAVPVFADCDVTGLVDLAECRRILRMQPGIRFFLPVHLYGHALDAAELASLRDEFGLKIVEDCAQSILATSRGNPTGSTGHACTTSFYPTKNLGAFGDGGAVLTSDTALADRIRALRDYGQSAKYRHTIIGSNSRLDEVQAAILSVFLPMLGEFTARRRAIARTYLDRIENPALKIPPAPPGSDSAWHLFPVLVEPSQKQPLAAHMKSMGVQTGEHYPLALNEQEALRNVPWSGETPKAHLFARSELSLPVHPFLTGDEVSRVIEAANSFKPL